MIHRTLPTLLVVLLTAGTARACTVPVFRYALEHWRVRSSDELYRVTIFHRGPLTEAQRSLVAVLNRLGNAEPRLANIDVAVVDVAEPIAERELADQWKAQHDP